MMKQWLIIGFVIALFGGGYWWWKRAFNTDTPTTQYITGAVERGTLLASVSGSGNVEVGEQATIDPTISGTVENLSVSIGDSVKKGQFLFSISNDQLDVSLASAQAALLQAKNAVFSANIAKDQARDAYDTRVGTALNKNILKQKIAVARLGIVFAEENLHVAELGYKKAFDDASKRRVVSPIDGTVNEINVKNGDDLGGNSVSASKVTPMIVGDLSTIEASVEVNEIDIPKVSLGQKATVTFGALEGVSLTGTVKKLNALGSIASGVVSYSVTIGFDTIDDRIKPGMSVSASIIYDVKKDALFVPSGAVKSDSEGTFVYILENGSPKRVSVDEGISSGVDTQIVRGLSEGDQIIIRTVNANASSANSSPSRSTGMRIPGLGGGR